MTLARRVASRGRATRSGVAAVARLVASALLAALHFAAASLPCPPAGAAEPRPEAGYAALALHATHAAAAADGARDARELRAACPCGCAHAPAAAGASPLPPALLRAAPALGRPADTVAFAGFAQTPPAAPPAAPDPVPRVA